MAERRASQDGRRVPIAAVVSELGGVGGEVEYHYGCVPAGLHRCVIEMAPARW